MQRTHLVSFTCALVLGASLTSQQVEVKNPAPPPVHVDPDLKTDAPPPVVSKRPAQAILRPVDAMPTLPKARPADADVPRTARLDPEMVRIDTGPDGTIWGGSLRYKASFAGSGATFSPFLGSDAPRNYPVAFALRDVRAGGQVLALAENGRASQAGTRVTIDHGACSEVYDLGGTGMEQSFVFAALPAAGDLSVRIGVTTELAFSEVADGFRFANARGHVSYGRAFVQDAAGTKIGIASTFADHTIELRVPASFLATARFPVTIDPVIAAFTVTNTLSDYRADVASDLDGTCCVVWEHAFSATDHDIGSQSLDQNGTVIPGSFQWIDRSGTYWANPSVANLREPHKFLVVAERGLAPSRQIWGQTRDAAAPFAVNGQFEISTNGGTGDKLNPDVGGDANPIAPVFWTVVWERTFSAADSDIHAQQVDVRHALRGGLILVDNSSGTIDTHPGISKSDGDSPSGSQDWTIVWQRFYSASDEDIRFARIHWDGPITTGSTALDSAGRSDLVPVVSSPTDALGFGSRYCLVVYQGTVAPGDTDLIGILIRDGTPLPASQANLSTLENVAPWRAQGDPHVDSDGCRFAVTYAELFAPATNDWDIKVATFHVAYGVAIGVSEAHANLADSIRAEQRPRITSMRSGGGAVTRYCAVLDDSVTASTNQFVKGALYDGHAPGGGGFTILPTGCDRLTIAPSGTTRLGEEPRFALTQIGRDIPMFMFSLPYRPLPLCGTCQLGIDLVTFTLFVQQTLSLPIPRAGELVGGTLAVQGLTFGIGGCLPQIRLSDTVQFTIQ